MIVDDRSATGVHIRCPMCGIEYTRFDGFKHKTGGRYEAFEHVRDDIVAVSFLCELNHSFDLILGHHKGMTYIWMEMTGEQLPPDFKMEQCPGSNTQQTNKNL